MSLDHIPGLGQVVHVAPARLRRVRRSLWWGRLVMFLIGVIVGQATEAIYPLAEVVQLLTNMWRAW